jgi:hypothetical protein
MSLNLAACSSSPDDTKEETAVIVTGAASTSGFDQSKFERFQGSTVSAESATELDHALGVHTSGAVWHVEPPSIIQNEIVTTLGIPGERPLLSIHSPRVDLAAGAPGSSANPAPLNPKVTLLVNGNQVPGEAQMMAVARSLNRDAGLLEAVRALDAAQANPNTAVHPEYFGWSCALSVGITLAGILVTIAGAVLAYQAGLPATLIGLTCLTTIGVAVRVVVLAFMSAIGIAVVGLQKSKSVEEALAYSAGFLTSLTVALQNVLSGLSTGAFAAAQACLTAATAAAGLLVAGLATTIVGGIQVADACFGVTGSPSQASCAGSEQQDCTDTCNNWMAQNGCAAPPLVTHVAASCSNDGSGATCGCFETACQPPTAARFNPELACEGFGYTFDDNNGFGGTEGDAVGCSGDDFQDEFKVLGSGQGTRRVMHYRFQSLGAQ